jgi:hypothetical protein
MIKSLNKTAWTKPDDALPPSSRKYMIEDLIQHHKLIGLSVDSLVNLLGEPDNEYSDSSSISYDLIVDYGHDIDPVYVKSLVFDFGPDSIIKKYKIEEWGKH